jgi:ankyrin repeat protein
MAFWASLGHYQRHGDGHYEIAESLLGLGIDVNHNDGRTILHAFAAHEDLTGVRWLLSHGADVSARAADGGTPLHAAATRNAGTKVISALLTYGADPRIVDHAGRTAADLAAARGKSEIVRCLVQSP